MGAQSFCKNLYSYLFCITIFTIWGEKKKPKTPLLDISIFPNQSSVLWVIHSPCIPGRVRLLLALTDAEGNTLEKGTIPIRTYFSAFLY